MLALGLYQAQAFVDGNKRTAFQTLDAFLWVNGWEYVAEPLALARRLEQAADPSRAHADALDEFESWLRTAVKRRTETA